MAIQISTHDALGFFELFTHQEKARIKKIESMAKKAAQDRIEDMAIEYDIDNSLCADIDRMIRLEGGL